MSYDLEGITQFKSSLLGNCYSRNVINILCLFSFCRYDRVTQKCNRTTPAVGPTWTPRVLFVEQ